MAGTIAGVLSFELNGTRYRVKGNVVYNLGRPQKEGIIGADGPHGYKLNHQLPKFELVVSDNPDVDLEELLDFEGTATLQLANGKTITLREGWFAGEGDVSTEESEISLVINGLGADEVTL